jgi:hypothetical protein
VSFAALHNRRPWLIRSALAVLVLVFALLALFPERHRAAATMTPTDPGSLGLGGPLGEFGAVNSVFGSQAAVEVVMKVARSRAVRQSVIKELRLADRLGTGDPVELERWLAKVSEVRSLRGGIVEIQATLADAGLARAIVASSTEATRNELSAIGRRQTAYKRGILEQLLASSEKRLANARAAYDTYRKQTRYAQPSAAIATMGGRVFSLQETIRAKEVQLDTARKFATDENMQVRQILAELAVLRQQLNEARSLNADQSGSIANVVEQSTRVRELERRYYQELSLHDNYERYLDGTAIEDVTQAAVIRVLEKAYVDTARQWNVLPAMLAILLLGLALAIEFYRLRPPVGDAVARA